MVFVISVLTAVFIGLLTYFAKLKNGEQFDSFKLARTVIIGIVIGVVAFLSQYELTMENYQSYIMANMGLVTMIDQGLKLIWRLIFRK